MAIFKDKTRDEILAICEDMLNSAIGLNGEDHVEALEIIISQCELRWLIAVLNGTLKNAGKWQWSAEKACQMLTSHYNRQAIKIENQQMSAGKSDEILVVRFEGGHETGEKKQDK